MSQTQPPTQRKFAMLPKVINGGIAGIIGVTCIFPLDLVKTRLQNQPIGPNGERMYSSIVDCFRKTYRKEGYFGMYRGSAVNILLIAPEKTIKIAGNDFYRHIYTRNDGTLPVLYQMAAGGSAGGTAIIITTPMDLLKIKMQDQGRLVEFVKKSGKVHERLKTKQLAARLLKEKGILGLYRGLEPTAMREISFSVIYFPFFAYLNSLGPRRNDDTGEAVFWCSFLSGLLSGTIAAVLTTPFDVLKTRMQAGSEKYDNVLDCFLKTFRREGAIAFSKGGLCRIMVLAPLFAITQTVYYLGVAEKLLSFFN